MTKTRKVKGKRIRIYIATTNSDTNDGSGVLVYHSYYPTKKDAEIGALGIGVQGTPGGMKERWAVKTTDGRVLLNGKPVRFRKPTKAQYALIPEQLDWLRSKVRENKESWTQVLKAQRGFAQEGKK